MTSLDTTIKFTIRTTDMPRQQTDILAVVSPSGTLDAIQNAIGSLRAMYPQDKVVTARFELHRDGKKLREIPLYRTGAQA